MEELFTLDCTGGPDEVGGKCTRSNATLVNPV